MTALVFSLSVLFAQWPYASSKLHQLLYRLEAFKYQRLCASISSARRLLILCIVHHLPLRVGCHANKLLVSPLKGLGRRCAAPHSMALCKGRYRLFMRKIEDFMYEYDGFWANTPGKCRIRIFTDDKDKFVGVCTALPENVGTSTTNRIEYIYTDIRERFFPKKSETMLPNDGKITEIEKFISDNKTSKPWAIACSLFLKGYRFYLKLNTPKDEESSPKKDRELIWIDHWPKGIGFKEFEHEFALVKFTSSLTPIWYHMDEGSFQKHIGIDLRLLEPLELEQTDA
ncbi:hypothetical protein [Endozoicomonas sp. 2B-B]